MALVAYGNSDSSEYEDSDSENVSSVALSSKLEEPSSSKPQQNGTEKPSSSMPLPQEDEVTASELEQPLFNRLPQPLANKYAVVEEDDEFLHKKESNPDAVKPKVKITVPSLSDFNDVEDKPNAKPKVASGKKSGLLSILPQPRNGVLTKTTSLIPHVLKQKPTTTAKKKEPLPSPMKKKEGKSLITYSDESDDDEVQNDFFSINKPVELPIIEEPLDIEPKPQPTKPAVNIQSYFKQPTAQSHVDIEPDYSNEASESGPYQNMYDTAGSSYESTPAYASNETPLDDEAIMKLCGTRGKRKRENIQIVDVNQQEVLAEARDMLFKGLMDDTTKRVSASKKKGNEPTNQQKRKHQITYLAHQAKANEAELQNQWANNRLSKRQTQSKYGF